jgi:hypothetical protein
VRRVRFHDLRHTFGTQMAAAGVPMRTLQEWLGHRDIKTTMIYADYQASDQERELVERAFRGPIRGPKLSETQVTSGDLSVLRALNLTLHNPLRLVVVQAVAGSNPVAHPSRSPR